MDCSPPGSSIHGILQARILEWVAIPFSSDLPDPGIKPRSLALQADSLLSEPLRQQINLPSVSKGDIISIFQGCLLYKHPWKQSGAKAIHAPAQKTCKTQQAHEELPSNKFIFLSFFSTVCFYQLNFQFEKKGNTVFFSILGYNWYWHIGSLEWIFPLWLLGICVGEWQDKFLKNLGHNYDETSRSTVLLVENIKIAIISLRLLICILPIIPIDSVFHF